VYGSLTLVLNEDENGLLFVTMKGNPPKDRFDFDWHKITSSNWYYEIPRNLATLYADYKITQYQGEGTDFDIIIEGNAYIYP
jgi:hypothetical protein